MDDFIGGNYSTVVKFGGCYLPQQASIFDIKLYMSIVFEVITLYWACHVIRGCDLILPELMTGFGDLANHFDKADEGGI